MEDCKGCELNCPIILAANQTATDLRAELETLDVREANRQTNTDKWATLLTEASHEQRMAPVVVDGEPVGNMYTQRDAGEIFSAVGRRSDNDARTKINNRLWFLEGDATARREACEKGPGKKYWLFGSTVCRSEVDD